MIDRLDRRIRSCLSCLSCLSLLVTAAASLAAPLAHGQGCLAGTAADEFTANRVGLEREWILQIPTVISGWHLEQLVVGDGLVVAQTGDGTVHAIQSAPFGDSSLPFGSPRPGTLLWSQQVGRAGNSVTRAGIGPDLIAVAEVRQMTGLERSTGQVRWRESFNQSGSTGTAAIGDWVYADSSGGGVTRFAAQPLRQPVLVAATPDKTAAKGGKKLAPKAKRPRKENLKPHLINDGGSGRLATVPIQLAEGVLWCTTDGLLTTEQPADAEWRRLEFSLINPPAGPPVVRGNSIFTSTTTGDLARIDLPNSLKKLDLIWHTVLPGPAVTGPFVTGKMILVSLGELGFAAYSTETGAELWRTCLTGKILAVGGSRGWFIDEVGRLSSLDLADGARRDMLCLGPFHLPVVNTVSDRLFLASESGTVVCLAPRGAGGTPTLAAPAATTAPVVPERGSSDPAAKPRP
ncbi:MAG: PQQ-binding-like beta-propeller repeat protein [Planctomycetota bacterium]